MESLDGTAMVCLRGESLTHHTNQMKLFNAIAAAAVIGTSFIAANPAEARNGWVHAGSYKKGGETITLYVKPIDRSGSIRRVEFYQPSSQFPQWPAKANCKNWSIDVHGEVIPVMPGSVNESAMHIVCH